MYLSCIHQFEKLPFRDSPPTTTMFAPDTHPSNEALDALITKYPETSGCLFQVYNDILYAQSWTDVNVVDLGLVLNFPRGAVKGRRDAGTLVYVVPCALTESLTYAWCARFFLFDKVDG